MTKLAVVAVGGNALIKDDKHITVEDQVIALRETAVHLANMIETGWNLAIGHGNGPQVGFILRRSEIAAKAEGMHEVPLDVCGADSQGAIGYEFQQSLRNEFFKRGLNRKAATVVTQMLVDRDDPAFKKPTKPIGSFMDEAEAKRREKEMGWSVVEDAGRGWRRVVASPLPKEIIEFDAVKTLIDAGQIVITVGGGGIPVIDRGDGELIGTAAVIDKDFASSLLAQALKADLFLIATAVEKVAIHFGKPEQKWLDTMTVAEAKAYLAEGSHFAKGSMAPKIQAAIWYLENGGKEALITNPESIGRALKGETGTHIVP
ncbi:MAG: carbamate kinase [Chloroflexi bacterium CFX1]|nr:carbamate kinase [Chloroflexi bacterium CFX1]MCQ3953373.1 carbamate kinase [Chloroflexota bacterium]MDL1918858.1 carbamate kinase [Chloroflexi bacterium CFX5]NUQ59417.1 carbamate kinase [Anaerolineales bacterium]